MVQMNNSLEEETFGIPERQESADVHRDYYYSIIPEAVLYAPISHKAYRLYGLLDRFAGANRRAFPSRATLAIRLRCSARTVDAAIKELVAEGFLTVEASYGKNGNQRSSNYVLHPSPDKSTRPDLGDTSALLSLAENDTPASNALRTGVQSVNRDLEENCAQNESQGSESQGSTPSRPSSTVTRTSSRTGKAEDLIQSVRVTQVEGINQPSQHGSAKPAGPKPRKTRESKILAEAYAKADPELVKDLFAAWVATGSGRSHPTDERLGYIARAMVDWGFSAEDVRDALTGWVNDPWEERSQFKDPKYLLRSIEDVEKFIDLKRNPPRKRGDPGAGLHLDLTDRSKYELFDETTAFGKTSKESTDVK